jgi:hypothetical protein
MRNTPQSDDTMEFIAQDSFEIDCEEPLENEYTPSATAGDYSLGNPWDAPGMSISDFI